VRPLQKYTYCRGAVNDPFGIYLIYRHFVGVGVKTLAVDVAERWVPTDWFVIIAVVGSAPKFSTKGF
jgi:hypothetical protein